MPDLATFQREMRKAMVAGGVPSTTLEGAVVSDTLPAERRIRVHQNNYRESLCRALMSLFPVARVFVGEQFIKGVFAKYIAREPPCEAVLSHYGAGLPDFLAEFAPVCQVPYLRDIIRLEWAIHSLQLVEEFGNALSADGTPRLSPNVRLVDSDYPILNLWMAGTGQIPPEAVSLKAGGQCALVTLSGGEVRLAALDSAQRQTALRIEAGEPVEGDSLTMLTEMGAVDFHAG
ncbi:HvfC/BufC N-terminal domain-containing protein [Kordiimonas aestuarii]|uniref:HvfC/BufC N-terminal domain-containing protein n=1 Tax=Kordiimonas aestuarii TaxID=1005925 RepID=UPI0021D14325|nr:DNA-binding domain-containing protein [Kordiimonas aestuarii]